MCRYGTARAARGPRLRGRVALRAPPPGVAGSRRGAPAGTMPTGSIGLPGRHWGARSRCRERGAKRRRARRTPPIGR
eukprot:1455955-Pleurochrysis_carterae.AAC.1